MNATRKLSAVQEAWGRAQEGCKMLRELGFREMEVSQEKCGIVWARWILPFEKGGILNVVLFATPRGYDIFEAVTYENSGPRWASTAPAVRRCSRSASQRASCPDRSARCAATVDR
jgi:hypothetical protein